MLKKFRNANICNNSFNKSNINIIIEKILILNDLIFIAHLSRT